jgi:hypothetical protein
MTDIVERLRGRPIKGDHVSKLLEVAANEIERLLGACKDKADLLKDAYAQIKRLRAVIVRAKDALLDGQSTQWVHDLLVDGMLGQAMTSIVERLRASISDLASGHWDSPDGRLIAEAAAEIEQLRAEFELFREAPSKLEVAQYEIERLRGIIREAMSALLIAQEDDQMSSAAYHGEWLGELIQLCQRGLEKQ